MITFGFTCRTFTVIGLVCCCAIICKAQSPESAAFSRAGETPVSLYSGRPQIGFPLATIRGRDLQITAGLQYQSGGVKVEEFGSWVGLNWLLDAGGAITRSIQGTNDFASAGYRNQPIPSLDNLQTDCSVSGTSQVNFIDGVLKGLRDSRPDVFYYNFQGVSGKFVFDASGNVVDLSRSGVLIKAPSTEGGEWIITTLDGTRYFFGGAPAFHEVTGSDITAWYVTKIISPRNEEADFTYQPYTYSYSLLPLRTENYRLKKSDPASTCDPGFYSETPRNYTIQSLYLSQITLNDARMVFDLSPRCDLQGAKKLEKISVYRNTTDKLNEYRFNYECNGSSQRLWLTEVQEFGRNMKAKPPYRFRYNNKNLLPSVTSYSQDYWGYYNGQSNTSLIPTFNVHDTIYVAGANKDTNLQTIVYGSLSRITFPTGGYQEFEFEPHRYQDYNAEVIHRLSNRSYSVCQGGRCTGGPTVATQNFSLNSMTVVTVNFDLIKDLLAGDGGTPPGSADYVSVSITGDAAHSPEWKLTAQGGVADTQYILLPKGNYTMAADLAGLGSSAAGQRAFLSVQFTTIEVSGQRGFYQNNGGGLRIKKITTYDKAGTTEPLIKRYQYVMPDAPSTSAGRLMSQPQYYYYTEIPQDNSNLYCTFLVRTSSSVASVSTSADGSMVGYDYVTEYEGDENDPANGRIISQYYNVPDQAGQATRVDPSLPSAQYYVAAFPDVPAKVIEPKNGYLKNKLIQRSFNGSYYSVQSSDYTYASTAYQEVPGIVIASGLKYSSASDRCRLLECGSYKNIASRIQLQQTTTTHYDGTGNSNGNTLISTDAYTYESNYPWQIKTITSDNSEGTQYVQKFFYPEDFTSTAMSGAIGSMQQKNILLPVIDRQRWKINGTVEQLLNSEVITYKTFGSLTLPYQRFHTRFDTPPTSWTNYSGTSSPGSNYELVSELGYDANGNTIQVKSEETFQSTILGYPQAIPLATASNAQAAQIAFTGFEDAIFGTWENVVTGSITSTQARTGLNSYTGGLSRSNIPAGRYVLSLWAKGGGTVTINGNTKSISTDWAWYSWELDVSGTVTVQNTGCYLDDVRLHPITSFMTSNTYDPGIGISSTTSANQLTTYFTYDDLYQQELIKDHDGNVLQRNGYQYQGITGYIQNDPVIVNTATVFSFSGSAITGSVTYLWNFGDGTPSQSGINVNHTYATLGAYEIQLTITADGVTYEPMVKDIYIDGALTAAIAVSNNSLGGSITFTANNITVNPIGTLYTWDFGDGGTAQGTTVSHTYTSLGAYPVKLTLSQISYPSQVINYTLTVTGQMQAVIQQSNVVTTEDQPVYWSAAAGTNPFNAIYTWNFGDGTSGAGSGQATHSYATPGTYTAILSVSYSGYTTVTDQRTVTVNYGPPILNASSIHQQNLGTNGSVKTIKVTINAATNGQTPYTYHWATGPGSTGPWTPAAATQIPEYTGDYSSTTVVQVIASDNLGHSSQPVTINLLILGN